MKWDKEQFKPEKIQLDMKQQTHFQLNLKRIIVIYAMSYLLTLPVPLAVSAVAM